ncbi:MAG: phosphonate ABC transporter, permease protein PhnE [Rhizobiales bacterium]|nr:phosphonate ABC transporter, permease protein PhnE [Hyphomicrobiales bacterium]
MAMIDAARIREIEIAYPEAFRPGFWKRYSGFVALIASIAYTAYCWWFFSVGAVLASANWQLAGHYLADWVSYEIRPDIEIHENHLTVSFSRFSVLGENPSPEWLVKQEAVVEKRTNQAAAALAPDGSSGSTQSSARSFVAPSQANVGTANSTKSSAGSFVAPELSNVGSSNTTDGGTGGAGLVESGETAPSSERSLTESSKEVVKADIDLGKARLVVEPNLVSVRIDGKDYRFRILRGVSVTPEQPLEHWAVQRREGATVYLDFGWSGRAEIQNDDVIVWRRFLGWANFVFDNNSPFWGKSAGDVLHLIFAGERIDPARSNAALAFNNIWYNQDFQHGDVWTKLLQTIVMAFVGTLFASLIAFPLCFLAARNITPNRLLNQGLKRFFDFLRSIDMLIWALFFTRGFGPGPIAGIAAIFFTDTGTLGKLYSEALENIDDKQREGVRSVGASPLAVQRYGVLPQVLPVFASQSLYFWESNTRSATIIGAVGAGGIGLKLWEAMRTNQNWENVFYMVILLLLVVFAFDAVSNALRSRLAGRVQS